MAKETDSKYEADPGRLQLLHDKEMVVVASEYLNGTPKRVIADRLGVPVERVTYYLKTLQARWRASALTDMAEAKSMELARIMEVERNAFIAYKKSQKEQVKYVTSSRDGGVDKDNKAVIYTESREERFTTPGDPRHLKIILECIERRCKMLGLDAPIKIDWRDLAKLDGYDPDAIFSELEQAIFTSMVSAGLGRSIPGSKESPGGRDIPTDTKQ